MLLDSFTFRQRVCNGKKVILTMVLLCALPQSKDRVGKSRRMKNPEKLAASTKKPLVARYIVGNRVILSRDPTHVSEYAT